MIINISDVEILLVFAEEMTNRGYNYAAFLVDQISDKTTIEFFRTPMEAMEYCFEMTTDVDYFKSISTDSLISNLNLLIQSGIDTLCNEVFDLTSFARLERERKEILENNLNINIMNQKNLEYLKDQLKYTGFGETFDQDLKEMMLKGEKEFKILHSVIYGKDAMSVELNFKKSDQSDMYFFNSYHANLKKEDSKEGLEQTFYINKDSNITLKEAYNLMEGRSINKDLKNKEGEVYNCWLKFDFKQADENGNFKLNHYHQNYGYDLEASLSKHAIKELDTPKYKEDLLNSLKKGNLQSVTFVVAGVESKQYVEANPQFKTLNVYDANFQRINHRESKEQKKENALDKKESKEQQKDLDGEPEGGGQKEGKKRKVKSQSI